MIRGESTTMLEELAPPSPKRRRLDVRSIDQHDSRDDLVLRHPLGLRPSGNAFSASTNLKEACGGFALLPDELIVLLLEGLDAVDLLQLGATCRALHAFTRNEELWRALFVESSPSPFFWRGTWRSTFLGQSKQKEPKVDCSNLFSDTLHRPFFCAHVPLESYSHNIPKSNEIARLDDLSVEAFRDEWFAKPFILTLPVKSWPVYKEWSVEELLSRYSDVAFRAESVDWPLHTYIHYMQDNHDESPLYLFDRSFAEKMGVTIDAEPSEEAGYWPPTCFGFDAFTVLARSGSTFHQDPNATSAWNAVIRGSKYWIMFRASPLIPPPPGVFVSEDRSEVTSPLSIAEWLLGYHAEARKTPGCIEGICYEGEVLHVPSGWYHLVLNLEPSIALTQNFVPKSRIGAALQFLRDQKQSISGFSADIEDPYTLFVDKLGEHDHRMLEDGLRDMEQLTGGNGSKWEQLTKVDEDAQESSGFSFAFGGDDDEVP